MKWLARIGLFLGLIIVPLDVVMLFTSLPTIAMTLLEAQLIMLAYALVIVSFLVTMSRFADLIGLRNLYLIALVIYGLFSIAAGLSPTAGYLIVARGFQGLAAAILLPLSFRMLPKKGFLATLAFGVAIAPLLAGFLVSLFGWRALFFLNVPLAAFSFIFIALSVEEPQQSESPLKLDLLGQLLLVLTLSTLFLAILQLFYPIAFYVLAIVFGALFVRTENRTISPIIEFQLFRSPILFLTSVTHAFSLFFLWGALFLLPFFLFDMRAFSPFFIGLTFLALTLPLACFSLIFGKILPMLRTKWMLLIGLILLLFTAYIELYISNLKVMRWTLMALFFLGTGRAMITALAFAESLRELPQGMKGLATSSWFTLQGIFACLGLAIIGTVARAAPTFTQGYRSAFFVLLVLIVACILMLLFFPFKRAAKPSQVSELD